MFDLPTETVVDKREYRRFHSTLIKNGFMMMQESVYCRLLFTPSMAKSALLAIRKAKPSLGIVQVLTVTEKQYANMEFIVGESHSEVLDSDKKLVIL